MNANTMAKRGVSDLLETERGSRQANAEKRFFPNRWMLGGLLFAIAFPVAATVTDLVDDTRDIHPTNKQDVGKRRALRALNKTFGKKDGGCTGPVFKAMKVKGGEAVLTFDGGGSELHCRDGQELNSFTIAGADGKFVPATARIEGETVVVSSAEVPRPKAVRFGWHELAQPNFFNEAGLPASPFRTDDPWSAKGGK